MSKIMLGNKYETFIDDEMIIFRIIDSKDENKTWFGNWEIDTKCKLKVINRLKGKKLSKKVLWE